MFVILIFHTIMSTSSLMKPTAENTIPLQIPIRVSDIL